MINPSNNCYPQLWGGLECSIVRIGNSLHDQLTYNQHYTHKEDLEYIASLGISALRYPILWERHETKKGKPIDWSWITGQLNTLQNYGIEPIVGLMHHGSGPLFTNLEDENFPGHFRDYASAVAKEFPWISYYVPINEPLTTARFSGLYGHWYPHKRNDESFCRMFLNEMKATILAMEAIKKVNPGAKLIQTEDAGQTFSTGLLQYQADFENQRRWLSYDILAGKFQRHHPLYDYFLWAGIKPGELSFFHDHQSMPDVLGLNYYITSDRYLDEQTELYPPCSYGGNHVHRYADVEAIRVDHGFESGLKNLLPQVASRYSVPIAITEVHMHCHREHQLRWLTEVWNECASFNRSGGNVIAITPWALLGSFGWNKLLTVPGGDYECGVFDIRSSKRLRRTALASCINALSASNTYDHPVIHGNGWWHQENRFYKPTISITAKKETKPSILIIGKNGTLGQAFSRVCAQRFLSNRLVGRDTVDICKPDQLEKIIDDYKPWAIVNTAGFVNVDGAEQQADECYNCNTLGAQHVAIACKRHGIKMVTFSTDLVFDGTKKTTYKEDDQTNPLNVYGRSKALAEQIVSSIYSSALIIRTSSFFSTWDKYNFAQQLMSNLSNGKMMQVLSDVTMSPTYVPDLVHVTLDLLIDDEKGLWHLINGGKFTWSDFAFEICERAGLEKKFIIPKSQEDLNLVAKRPVNSALKSERADILPSVEAALNSFFCEWKLSAC